MKNVSIVLLAALLAFSPLALQAQVIQTPDGVKIKLDPFLAIGTSPWIDVSSYGVTEHTLVMNTEGIFSLLNMVWECSDNRQTVKTTLGATNANQGGTMIVAALCKYFRIRVTDFNGTPAAALHALYIGKTAMQTSVAQKVVIDSANSRAVLNIQPAAVFPLPPCNALRSTNCSPKGF